LTKVANRCYAVYIMQRTQVYFPKEVLDELRREAYEKRKTLAAIIREKVAKTTGVKSAKTSKSTIVRRLKLLDEISNLNLPTTSPQNMKKAFSEAHDARL